MIKSRLLPNGAGIDHYLRLLDDDDQRVSSEALEPNQEEVKIVYYCGIGQQD